MTPAERKRLRAILHFRLKLADYVFQLEDFEVAEQEARLAHLSVPRPPRELEEARHELLRLSGAVEPVFDRVIGRIMKPQVGRIGPAERIWMLALQPHELWKSSYFAKVIVDNLDELVGRLEASPSLFEPPVAPIVQRPQFMAHTVNVYGTIAQVGTAGAANIPEELQNNVRETVELLAQLRTAIDGLDAPYEEREGLALAVAELQEELQRSRPRFGPLAGGWGAVKTFATIEGVWQGYDRIQHISAEVAPKVEGILHALTLAGK